MDMKRFSPPRSILSANPVLLAGLVALGGLALAACRGGGREEPSPSPSARTAVAATPAPVDHRPVVLFVGTSLTAGLGLDPSEAYPALLQKKIDAAGLRYRVVNAGVSGETSAGAERRLAWLMRQPV